jgi:hypothetical protein
VDDEGFFSLKILMLSWRMEVTETLFRVERVKDKFPLIRLSEICVELATEHNVFEGTEYPSI